MNNNGWIKIHRKILEWEWYDDINTKVLFIHLLLTANHEDKKWRGILIKRGQKLTSLAHLAEETRLSVKNVRTSLTRLISTKEVANHSTSKYRIVTVNSYDDYQVAGNVVGKQPANSRQTSGNKQEYKNYKNINNKKINKKEFSEESLRLSEGLFKCIEFNNPELKHDDSKIKRWAKDIDLMIRVDDRDPSTIEQVIKFALSSDFWKGNILSGAKLRKHYESLYIQAKKSHTQQRPCIINT